MPTQAPVKSPLKFAQAALAKPFTFKEVLEKLNAKDKLNVENHVAACEAEPTAAHAKLWKRLACTFMSLSSNLAKVNGQQSIQFYVPDGKYRKQVFAIEDLRDGHITIYCGDILDEALKAKVFQPAKDSDLPDQFKASKTADSILIERIDGSTPNASEFFKHMVGWNRKALRIILPITSNAETVDAALTVCAMSMANGG